MSYWTFLSHIRALPFIWNELISDDAKCKIEGGKSNKKHKTNSILLKYIKFYLFMQQLLIGTSSSNSASYPKRSCHPLWPRPLLYGQSIRHPMVRWL